ncbi:MAG: hypothetical protein A3E01_00385 [Gammaproteobacteria bacterium RIFCSPHIGHO2_12_FULL_63_22]|nr:MAG: hypothetical protein A3E01_00385 [Gammaproteobacteria bacterium RIFCSPHIGHO2_12_FULL_63_22]
MTPQFSDLGEWIRVRFGEAGQGGLAAKLKPPVSKNAVSMWKTGKNRISAAYEKQIRALGYDGPLPEVGGDVTKADIESLQEEIRTQAAWVREELRKENTALAADLQEVLKQLAELRGTQPAESP